MPFFQNTSDLFDLHLAWLSILVDEGQAFPSFIVYKWASKCANRSFHSKRHGDFLGISICRSVASNIQLQKYLSGQKMASWTAIELCHNSIFSGNQTVCYRWQKHKHYRNFQLFYVEKELAFIISWMVCALEFEPTRIFFIPLYIIGLSDKFFFH